MEVMIDARKGGGGGVAAHSRRRGINKKSMEGPFFLYGAFFLCMHAVISLDVGTIISVWGSLSPCGGLFLHVGVCFSAWEGGRAFLGLPSTDIFFCGSPLLSHFLLDKYLYFFQIVEV